MFAETGVTVPTGITIPPALVTLAGRVTSRLDDILDHEIERWSALDSNLVPPLASLLRLSLSGGKRLRAAFCFWSFIGAGGDPEDPQIIDVAAAFELLQVFALIHDDVMDASPTRRGTPTVHIEFAEHHRSANWRGSPEHFGEGVAILVGDVAHVYADRLMTGIPREAADVWHELRIEVNVGQYLDLLGTVRGGTDLATARRIARYKSGKYTIERPLHLGAALTERLDELRPYLDAYGVPLGEAFQLRDDLLGVFGLPELTGKPIGGDLQEGKPTPLMAIAKARANPKQQHILGLVGTGKLDANNIAAIQQVLIDTGAKASCEDAIQRLTHEAARALDNTILTSDAVETLRELAYFVGSRNA